MVNISGITGIFKSWLLTGTFWVVGIIILGVVILIFYVSVNKKRKLKYNVLELVSFGNGKVGINKLKAGIFKAKTFFFGLIDFGVESIVKTSDGRQIQKARTSQLHDIMGKKGFIVIRKSDDPKILVPIPKIHFKNLEFLFEIAPANYRDASVEVIRESVKETQGAWEKIFPYVAVAFIIVACIITTIVNMQMTNHTVEKVGDMLIQGCSNRQNIQGGASP